MSIAEVVKQDEVPSWSRSADVVVIGQGVAGSCAALEAKRAGADVLVIERASGGGGASAVSSGIFYLGGGTAVQKACGYNDTPEEMARFLIATTQPSDPEKVRLFCEHSVEHFDWLEAQGVPFERTYFKGKAVFLDTTECLFYTGNEKVWPYCDLAAPAPRGHKVAGAGESAGSVAMAALLAQCEKEAIPALYDTRVTSLVVNSAGRVVGVRARQTTGDIHVEARRGVIIAAGSFNMNEQMIRENIPLLGETSIPLGVPSNDGAGIRLGQSVGAALEAMDGVIATASIYPPAQLIKGIIVNKRGERFVAEDAYHGRTASFIMEQPDQVAYLIVDSEVFAYPEITSAGHRLVDGWETVAEMEAALGMPTGALQRTMAEYNRGAAAGEDAAFHKQPEWLKPLDVAPYAAFDISFNRSSYLFITLGGLRAGLNGEALDEPGKPVPGLYVVGASAAHIPHSGKTYASGLSLGPGSFFGRRAGRHAAGVVT
ncbi:MAG: FAD-binding protein [Steroidobacteraceae bacterium]|jgi:succinate dehydrogenase/fumarate reductase flavoprotein subunit|nr:FAD-binding protein [Steroidobacteraceae bacterium]